MLNVVKTSYFLVFIAYLLDYLELNIPTGTIKQGTVILLLISFIYSLRNNLAKRLIFKPIPIIFLILFNSIGLLTALVTDTFTSSVITLVGLNIYFILYYFNSYRLSLTKDNLISFNNIVIFSTVSMCFVALLANPSLTISQLTGSTLYYGRLRVYGIFQEPNLFSAVCFVILSACFINLILSDTKKRKFAYILIGLLGLFWLIISDSRGALYFFLAFVLLFFLTKLFYKFNQKTRTLWITLTILASIIVIPMTINVINQILYTSFDEYNYISSGRLNNWNTILSIIKNDSTNYFFGTGLSSGDQGPLFELGMTSDNGYLIWFYQAGIISLSLIILLLLNVLRVNIKNKTLNAITVPLFISYLLYAFFENFLLSFGHIVPFYCWTISFIAFHAKDGYLLSPKKSKYIKNQTEKIPA